MGEVKYFNPGDDSIIENLESALADAKAGRLKFMMLSAACVDKDGTIYSTGGFAGDIKHVVTVLGEIEMEKHSLLSSLDEILAEYAGLVNSDDGDDDENS